MANFLDYINKKLEEDKVSLSLKKPELQENKIINIVEPPKLVIKKSKEVVSDINIAKNILEGVSDNIKPYHSNLGRLVKVNETISINNKGEEQTINDVMFSRSVSSDCKHAGLL